MSYTLIDYFKEFHSLKQKHNLSANAQACYFSILGEFNAARFPEQLSISDRELKTLAGLKSVATAHDAKRILKNLNLIDFQSGRGAQGTTWYRLCTEHLPNINRTLTEHSPNINRTFGAVPYIHAGEDVKKDVKTFFEEEEDARAGVQAGERVDEMDIHDVWRYETGCPLTGSVAYELERLANEDFDGVHKAIIEAVKSKTTREVRYNFFKKIYDDMKKPKGAVSDERSIEEEDLRAKWRFSD